jgi:hypothetical protein
VDYPAIAFGPELLRLFVDCLSSAHNSTKRTATFVSCSGDVNL